MQDLNGYTLDESSWETKGGGGQCNIGLKDGKRYFIKRISKPKYPDPDMFIGDFREQRIRECSSWLQTRKRIINALPGNGTGTLIKPIEYFREGFTYYEVANYIDIATISYKDVYKESIANKTRIMLTVARSLADVHKAGIVHGDLDPGNILISRASGSGNLITKVIDFTDSFFESDPPEKIMSKEFWWSPEVALYSLCKKEPNPYKRYITCKADVFSLGIIFHQYCTEGGRGLGCAHAYAWQELLDNKKPQVDSKIEPVFQKLIQSMLTFEPDDRPTMEQVHKYLFDLKNNSKPAFNQVPKRMPAPVSTVTTTAAPSNPPEPAQTRLEPGSGKNGKGAGVKSAKVNEAGKIIITFQDGEVSVYPKWLAIRLGYAKEI